MTKLYNKKLSEIFTTRSNTPLGVFLKDKHKQSFGWQYNKTENLSSKIFYAIGCSWIQSRFLHRVFLNSHSDYLMINRAVGGQGNSMIIDTVKKDVDFLNDLGKETIFLVCFSEVGRNQKDFSYANPSRFSNAHDYFSEILKAQYSEIAGVLKNVNSHITTSWVPNNFNDNKTILDFCGDSINERPKRDVYHYNSGLHYYMSGRRLFDHFDHLSAIEETAAAVKWVIGHEHVDETMHVQSYEPYESFLDGIL